MAELVNLTETVSNQFEARMGFRPTAIVRINFSDYSLVQLSPIYHDMVAWIDANCERGAKCYDTPSIFVFEDEDEAMTFYLAFSHV